MSFVFWGLAGLSAAAMAIAAWLRCLIIGGQRARAEGGQPAEPPLAVSAKAEGALADESVPLEVRLSLFSALVFLHPALLAALLHAEPSARYWFGHSLLLAVVLVAAAVVACHAAVARKAVRGGAAAGCTVVFGAAVLALVCQLQGWQLRGQGAALLSKDCGSLPGKALLDRAWWAAHDLLQDCAERRAAASGAGVLEARLAVRLEDCGGFAEASALHMKEWKYLRYLEEEQGCGGWCTAQQPIWAPHSRAQDSCSRVAAQALVGSLGLAMRQVTAYAGLLLVGACLALLLGPGWLWALLP